MKKVIKGATKEHPYVQEDYPFGFKLRCKRRLWVETKKGFGMRVVSQTSNPKKCFESWNAPKAGTYMFVCCWVVDEEAKTTEVHGISLYDRGKNAKKFLDEIWKSSETPEIHCLGYVEEEYQRLDLLVARWAEFREALG